MSCLLPVPVEVDLQIINCILLTAQQKHDLIVYELELPCHLLIDVVDLVHRPDGPMDRLEVGQIFVKSALHPAFFLATQGSLLLPFYALADQVLLAAMGDEQCRCLFEGLFGL